METTFLYGIFVQSVCVYVGQSESPAKRLRSVAARYCLKLSRLKLKVFREIFTPLAPQVESQIIKAFKRRRQANLNREIEPKRRFSTHKKGYVPSLKELWKFSPVFSK